ncbi:MAG: type IV toxin-antitoxin system AbiEi family antitoxin domain-containing protein, partial [Solirubrobacterales bacterium]
MRDQGAKRGAALAELAARQHGVAALAQLRAPGFDERPVHRRAAAGRLHRVHRGVYAVGHPQLSFQGRCLAAVMACGGPGPLPTSVRRRQGPPAFPAVVSHRSAAALWGMLSAPAGWIEVSIPSTNGRKRRRGIILHRSAS